MIRETVKKVTTILAKQPDSIKKYFRLVDKKQLDEIGADPDVQLALTGLNGTTFGNKTDILVDPYKKVKGTHGFYPDHKQIQTGFVASGAGLKKGTMIKVMNMVDVAPIVTRLTGTNIPNMDGKLYLEMFK